MGKKVKGSSNGICYKRDESKMVKTPYIVIVTMPLVILITGVSLVVCVIMFFKGMLFSTLFNVCAVLAVLGLSWGIFSDEFFNWFENCQYVIRDNRLFYEYSLNNSVVGSSNSMVSIEIKNVTKFKVRGKKGKLRGKFIKKAPRQSDRELRKVTVQLDFSEKECIINHIKERMSS